MRKLPILVLAVILTVTFSDGCAKRKDDAFHIGVNQLVEHTDLDAAYKGFVDALEEAGYEDGDKIRIDYRNAGGDQSKAESIAKKLVKEENDLIFAIGTPAAQAVANATKDIPILVTAVTDPAASKLVASNEAPGGNVSGTSDMTPVKAQIKLLTRLVPKAKNVAILYSSDETGSKDQVKLAKEAAKEYGLEIQEVAISDPDKIQETVEALVGKTDALYIPTDNLLAKTMPLVAEVANANELPNIVGQAFMVDAGGMATYEIDYYELGKLTGRQAVKIIEGRAKTADMPIEYSSEEYMKPVFNEAAVKQLGIHIPDDLKQKKEQGQQ